MISYEWRGSFTNDEVGALHAEAFDHPPEDDDRLGQLSRHSLGWVVARESGCLAGFVNVAWNGGGHAFILDTMVSKDAQHRGVAGSSRSPPSTPGPPGAPGCTSTSRPSWGRSTWRLAAAHTTNDSIVWIPDRSVLFCGDLPDPIDATLDYLRFVLGLADEARAAGLTPLEAARQADLGRFAGWPDDERIVGNLHRAMADLSGTPRGGPINIIAALADMVTYNGGVPLTCRA